MRLTFFQNPWRQASFARTGEIVKQAQAIQCFQSSADLLHLTLA